MTLFSNSSGSGSSAPEPANALTAPTARIKPPRQREVLAIFGQTGSGKTYHAREIARSYPRVLVADAGFGDFAPIPQLPDYDALLSFLESARAFDGGPFRASLDFRPHEYDLAFATALSLEDCLLVLDEADRFPYGGEAGADHWEALYRGRHYGVSLAYVSLQPTAIPTDIRRQLTRLISFRQIFPADIDWLRVLLGDAADILPELPGPPASPPHPFVSWTPLEGAFLHEPGKTPQKIAPTAAPVPRTPAPPPLPEVRVDPPPPAD